MEIRQRSRDWRQVANRAVAAQVVTHLKKYKYFETGFSL
jgi:hypothetical protein